MLNRLAPSAPGGWPRPASSGGDEHVTPADRHPALCGARPPTHSPLPHLRQSWEEGFRSGAAAHVPTIRDTGRDLKADYSAHAFKIWTPDAGRPDAG